MTGPSETVAPESQSLTDLDRVKSTRAAWAIGLVALIASAAALGLAPLVLPDSYSWVEHTTSESGAQAVDGAWLARTGFLLFGLGVLWIAFRSHRRWRQPATFLHLVFAVSMIGVAVYSLRSWLPEAAYHPAEDLMHSVGATVMGFAFAFGVTADALRRRKLGYGWRMLDIVAVVASVVLPVGMSMYGSIDGVLQRLMFLIAYIWYAREACISDPVRWRGPLDKHTVTFTGTVLEPDG